MELYTAWEERGRQRANMIECRAVYIYKSKNVINKKKLHHTFFLDYKHR